MGLLQLVGSKVGHLLSRSSDAEISESYFHWHSSRLDRSNSHEDPDVGLRKKQPHYFFQRRVSESDLGEEFHGPDTTSLSAFLYSFFSTSDVAVRGTNDQSFNQSHDEAKFETVTGLIPEVRFKNETLVSDSAQNLEKQISENVFKEKDSSTRFEDSDLEQADWHLISDHDVGKSMVDSQVQKPANLITLKLPSMSEASSLLSEASQQSLFLALPTLARGRQWTLIYSTQRHGISLLTLYRRSGILPAPYLLVTGDTKGAIFGGLLSAPLKPTPSKKYQGTSETFVFTDVSGKPELYHPTGLNRYFILCTNDALALGGGGHFALRLDNDLLTGSSGACATFGNLCLAHSEDFVVKNVELWGFSHSSRYVPRAALFEEPREPPGLCRW